MATTSTQRVILRPQPNIPLQFLMDAEPTEKESQFGPAVQWQYICNDGAAIMWLDGAAHAAILAAGARPGHVVSLCKRGSGSRAAWDAEVQPVDDQTQAHPAPTPAPRPAPRAPVTPIPTRNGNAHHEPATPKAAAPAPGEAQHRPAAKMLAAALCSAIDAMQEAEAYAGSKGLTLNFSVDDVRAMGISLYISAEKGSQR